MYLVEKTNELSKAVMKSTDFLLASIQSIGQRLDHLAQCSLSEEATSNYLTKCNLHQLQLTRKTQRELRRICTDVTDRNAVKEETSSDIEEQSSEDSFDSAETQIMLRMTSKPSTITIQSLTDSLDKDLKQTDLWLQRGRLWQEQDDYAAALSDFLHAHRLSPTNKRVRQALLELRTLCAHQGKQIKGMQNLCVVLDNDDSLVHHSHAINKSIMPPIAQLCHA